MREETLQKRRESNSKWQKDNHEHVLKYQADYRAARREQEKQRVKAWRTANRARHLASVRAYHVANREREAAYLQERRKNDPGFAEQCRLKKHNRFRKIEGQILSEGLIELLFGEQGGKCPYCFSDLTESGFHLDHFVPIALGGKNEDENMQLACPTCNRRKGAKHPAEFLREMRGCP